ncbi:hypothetical protein C7448_10757 [Tenacibaculum gallaicum]|uniref:Uncharacterized protein n=1 Tax=Tenacibaculum gallaicum TaxID=561505 RepID=A0A3E0HJ98_9FLAO|nr:hypothetical protein [Tenacibaculum gallaicum]REH46497.1 hypothetical protein C7448_10757 [Tenacibaculum gallaicum]
MEEIKLNPKNVVDLNKEKRVFKKIRIEIINSPENEDIDYSKTYSKKILKSNDSIYVYNPHDMVFYLYIGGGAFLLGLLSILLLNIRGKALYFYSSPMLMGIIYIIFHYLKRNKKKFILDRSQGLISYPDYLLKKPITTKFEDLVAVIGGKGSYGALILKLRQTSFLTNYHINNYAPYRFWSFMVWYMDKNRPLPPGKTFDPYRQKDFERRKAEGFPPPLYYSCGIPTPEATPEQQAEREQYWKDEEYYAPDIKRPKDSEIFNKRTHKNWSPCVFGEKEAVLANKWYEFTFANGKVVYMLTNEKGEGFLPPEDEKYEVASLTLKDTWF